MKVLVPVLIAAFAFVQPGYAGTTVTKRDLQNFCKSLAPYDLASKVVCDSIVSQNGYFEAEPFSECVGMAKKNANMAARCISIIRNIHYPPVDQREGLCDPSDIRGAPDDSTMKVLCLASSGKPIENPDVTNNCSLQLEKAAQVINEYQSRLTQINGQSFKKQLQPIIDDMAKEKAAVRSAE